MTAPMFYVAVEQLAGIRVGDLLTLDGDEGRHAVAVKRLRVGERLLIGDGENTVCELVVHTTQAKQSLSARVVRVNRPALPQVEVTVIQALIKGDRMDRALETMTEAGADAIAVWASANTVVKLETQQQVKVLSRFRKKAYEASKQARRSRIPRLDGLLREVEVLERVAHADLAILLDETAQTPLPVLLPSQTAADVRVGLPERSSSARSVLLIVGPEGGVTAHEREVLVAAGALPARMGPDVMRASTAATVALGWVMGALGKWSVSD